MEAPIDLRSMGGTPDSLSERHELKVRLPLLLHVKLHSLKILEHRPIAQIVEEAIELYLRDHSPAPVDVSPAPDPPTG